MFTISAAWRCPGTRPMPPSPQRAPCGRATRWLILYTQNLGARPGPSEGLCCPPGANISWWGCHSARLLVNIRDGERAGFDRRLPLVHTNGGAERRLKTRAFASAAATSLRAALSSASWPPFRTLCESQADGALSTRRMVPNPASRPERRRSAPPRLAPKIAAPRPALAHSTSMASSPRAPAIFASFTAMARTETFRPSATTGSSVSATGLMGPLLSWPPFPPRGCRCRR